MDAADVERMAGLLTHAPFYEQDPMYCAADVAVSALHFGPNRSRPYASSDVCVWLEGAIYNAPTLATRYSLADASPEHVVAALYRRFRGDWKFVREISGEFAVCIFDVERREVHLVADRLGSKPVYMWNGARGMSWAHEVKAFLALPDFKPSVSADTAAEFMAGGFFSNNRTWFDGVTRLAGSTIASYDIRRGRLSQTRYWRWQEVTPLAPTADRDEVLAELDRLFIDAVHARIGTDVRIAVTLSGGLDSRAILSVIPEDDRERTMAYTFGKAGCDEIAIARRAAAAAGVSHAVFELNEANWILPRISGVWVSDGMLDLLHMHGVEFYNQLRAQADVVVNGILGGGLIGGLFGSAEIEVLEKRIAGRSIIGVTLESSIIDQRMPFFDNALNELIFAIPPEWKRDARLYRQMLVRYHAPFFATIPDANTGCALTTTPAISRVVSFRRRAANALYHKLPFPSAAPRSMMHDYRAWIRAQPARGLFERVLGSPRALYQEHVSRREYLELLDRHLRGRANHAAELCRLLTFELWLQQVFNGQFRNAGTL